LRLFQRGRTCEMAGLPRFEFTRLIVPARGAQLGYDLGILRGEPVLQLVESFYGGENLRGNFNRILNRIHFHGLIVSHFRTACK
jgi:hypothetical protein